MTRRPASLAEDPRVSVIVPAGSAGNSITGVVDRLFEAITLSCEVIVVVDGLTDPTLPFVVGYTDSRLRYQLTRECHGTADAIRSGLAAARANVIVVTMPDGGDDLRQIDDLTRLVERGCAIASASRYVRGGQPAGAPLVRSIVSRGACRSLQLFTKLGTTDATNSFKACSAAFAKRAGIDSRNGSDIGIELAAKARRLRLPIAEIPTIGVDQLGSSLAIVRSIPSYVRWYLFCFGPRLTMVQLRAKATQLPLMRYCD